MQKVSILSLGCAKNLVHSETMMGLFSKKEPCPVCGEEVKGLFLVKIGGKQIPVDHMIGVIGVAPEKGKSVPCGYPGSHGGNLDCKLMVKGNTAYFPVRVEGGLVQMGDMHAVMGDSELCGTGLEINGTVIARVSVIKNCPLEWPVLETADTWYTMASAAGYEEALRHASVQMQDLVAAATGWDATDAYLYMSLRGDLEVCQACKPCEVDLIVRLGVPKADMKRPLVG